MTKQEKIGRGLEKLFRKWEEDSPDAGYGYEPDIWIPELLSYLHKQDVVIKVKQQFPACLICSRAGYVAFEPLVKE